MALWYFSLRCRSCGGLDAATTAFKIKIIVGLRRSFEYQSIVGEIAIHFLWNIGIRWFFYTKIYYTHAFGAKCLHATGAKNTVSPKRKWCSETIWTHLATAGSSSRQKESVWKDMGGGGLCPAVNRVLKKYTLASQSPATARHL